MKLISRLLTFVMITVVTLSLVGLASFGLAAFFKIMPPFGQFIVGLLVGWLAWDASAPSTDH